MGSRCEEVVVEFRREQIVARNKMNKDGGGEGVDVVYVVLSWSE